MHRLLRPVALPQPLSFLDSTLSPTAIVELAKRHGLPAVALTDTGNLHGVVEFVQAAQSAGIKPIIGAELRVGSHPLLLYAANTTGYLNLCRLLSQKAEGRRPKEESSVVEGQRAPVTSSFLLHHSAFLDGLLAVSSDATLAEFFPGRFYQMACKRLVSLSSGQAGLTTVHWGHEPATGEPAPQGCCRHLAGSALLRPAGKMPAAHWGSRRERDGWARRVSGFPIVACPAIHYATPEDRRRYDILQSIRTLTLLEHEHPGKRRGGRYHFRTPAEMAAGCAQHPEWLSATHENCGAM